MAAAAAMETTTDPPQPVDAGDLAEDTEQASKGGFFSRFRKSPKAEEEEEVVKPRTVGFLELFKYTSRNEKMGMIFACICAAIHGSALPLFTILFGNVITTFNEAEPNELIDELIGITKWFFIIGAVAAVLATIQIRFMLVGAQATGARIRKLYFRSLMKMNDGWYDAQSRKNQSSQAGAYITRLSDVNLIQAGIGDKVSILVQYTSMFVVGFVVAFIYSWRLTLAVLATSPLLVIAGGVMAYVTTDSTTGGLGAYSRAGGIANEAISMIRTVTAFGAQAEEEERFKKELDDAYKSEIKKGFAQGVGLGVINCVFMCLFGFALWFGWWLLKRDQIGSSGDVFIVFFSVLIGASGLGQAGPHMSSITTARGAAPEIFDIIENDSEINPLDLSQGETYGNLTGSIEFKNVTFQYPTRPTDAVGDLKVLENFNLEIPAGSSQSLVGESGSGKSTIARLIERFYDVEEGQVLIDGRDIRDYNVSWLRNQIGYVGQLPTLFATSIKENIAFGVEAQVVEDPETGEKILKREEPSMAEIIEAAKQANAHDFIQELPEGYDTVLGARGALLSGGQRQRVCIARALIRKPKILILDEATASLDSKSEATVQEAIDKIMKTTSITTVIIAHRLSTVKDSDKIAVLNRGKIEELGNHDDLMRKNGAYKNLINAQNVSGKGQTAGKTDNEEKETKDESEEKKENEEEEETQGDEDDGIDMSSVLTRAFKYNRSEALYIILGLIGSCLSGASWPVSSIPLSRMTTRLTSDAESSEVRTLALMFALIGVLSLVGTILQLGLLGISGNKLTQKMRIDAFRKILSQDMKYFDESGNDVGSLTTRLSTDTTLVRGLTGDTLGTMAVALSTLGTGLVIAFVACWRIALVILALVPGIVLAGYMEMKLMTGFDSEYEKQYEASAGTASEAIDGVVTVRSLGVQDRFIEVYDKQVDLPTEAGKKKSWLSAAAFGFSQLAQFVIWGLAFLVGGRFVKNGSCSWERMLIGITGLIFGAATLGNLAAFTPDFAASRRAAAKIFQLLDSDSDIDPYSPTGNVITNVKGKVDIDSIEFQYPSRPDIPVLRGLSLAVQPGKTVAIVGESGSGKSTVVQLIQRFYDVTSGSIKVEDNDVRNLNVQSYRSNLGYVQQEPDLFNRSIRDNICYGLASYAGAPITEDMVENAAKEANAHDFIMTLPGTYDYIVGERGSLLSGGQKQRVAIARSLIRQPKILLLDEATSALDAESERICQEALDNASKTRTTIVVAHRLSSFKSADTIAVVRYGEIVEMGTHEELMRKRGYYPELIRNQLTE